MSLYNRIKEPFYILSGLFITLVIGLVLDYIQSSLAGQLIINFCFLSLVYLIYWRLRGKPSVPDVVKGVFLFIFTTAVILVRAVTGW